MIMLTCCTRWLLACSLLLLFGCSTQNRNDPLSGSSDGSRSHDSVLYQQAITHLNSNEPDKAEKIFQSLAKKNSAITGVWVNLGIMQLKRGKLEESEKLLKTALDKDPTFPQTLNLLGLIEIKKGNIRQAEKLYTQAIMQKDGYAIAHYNLALLYDTYLQDIKQAIPHYQRYLDLTDHKDVATANWLEELKSTLSKNRP